MRKRKKYFAALLAVVMCLGLAACGKDFDAAGYVKSVLDANYHGEYEEYAEFRGLSEESAKMEIENNMNFLALQEFNSLQVEVGDETKNAFLDCIKSIMPLAKYEVKEAEKQDDDSYVVTVEVTPSDIYQTLEDNSAAVTQEMLNNGQNPLEDGEAFVDLMIQSVNRSIEGNTYGEPSTIEVKVAKDEDDAYAIDESEMSKIEEALFPQA